MFSAQKLKESFTSVNKWGWNKLSFKSLFDGVFGENASILVPQLKSEVLYNLLREHSCTFISDNGTIKYSSMILGNNKIHDVRLYKDTNDESLPIKTMCCKNGMEKDEYQVNKVCIAEYEDDGSLFIFFSR